MVPKGVEHGSVLGVSAGKDDVVGVYTWTPQAGVGGAGSSVIASIEIVSVRQDVYPKYLEANRCVEAKEGAPPVLIYSCKGDRCMKGPAYLDCSGGNVGWGPTDKTRPDRGENGVRKRRKRVSGLFCLRASAERRPACGRSGRGASGGRGRGGSWSPAAASVAPVVCASGTPMNCTSPSPGSSGRGTQRSLMRGSMKGAARSARRLPSTIAIAATRVTPMMIGMSTRWIACQASWPMPGQP